MSIELVKSIRAKTSLSLKEIKKAIEELGSADEQSIIDHLRKQGALKAQKRQDRQTSEGGVFCYSHEGRIGVMAEVRCETDFVSRGDDFQQLGKDLTLHIAAMQPKFVAADEMDQDFVDKEMEVARAQLVDEGKPAEIIDKILEGKKGKLAEEVCLLAQPFFKDSKKSVGDIITEAIQTTGEKIEVARFTTYSM